MSIIFIYRDYLCTGHATIRGKYECMSIMYLYMLCCSINI